VRKDAAVEVERLTALNRALTQQLEVVRTDFGSFLGLLGEADVHPMPDAVLGVTPPLERYRNGRGVLETGDRGAGGGVSGDMVTSSRSSVVRSVTMTSSARRSSATGSVIDAIVGAALAPPALAGAVQSTTRLPASGRPAPIPLASSRGPSGVPTSSGGALASTAPRAGGASASVALGYRDTTGAGSVPLVTPVRLSGAGGVSTAGGGGGGLDAAGFAALRARISALDGSVRPPPRGAAAASVGAAGSTGSGDAGVM
jgi:hypothetical protein